MKAVVHASDNTFSALGQDLKKRIAMQVKFYESMSPMTMKAISIEGQSDLMHGMDDFLCNFNRMVGCMYLWINLRLVHCGMKFEV
jgi:hypothetical protein